MENSFGFVVQALQGTPAWVWVVFVFLIIRGWKARQANIIYLPLLFVVPALLIGLKYKIFTQDNPLLLQIYFLGLIVGIGIGFWAGYKTPLKVFKNKFSMEVPGNYHTLVLFILFFSFKYFFGYLQATQPTLAAEYVTIETGFTALFSGFFLGKALAYVSKFLSKHPDFI